jgi:TonB-dependent starch-binding outer membrane protein SusC
MKKTLLYDLFCFKRNKKEPPLWPLIALLMLLIIVPGNSLNAGLPQVQKLMVSGTITDAATGEVMPSVNVVIKGTSIGVATDNAGKYTIEVPSPALILQFSFIGYQTIEVTVGNQTNIDMALKSNVTEMEELVVIGYQTKRKKDITGAISSISGGSIASAPVKDVLTAMQGRASGVQVISNSGAPGDGVTVRVRGFSSLNSGNDPLYVIDGIPVESTTMSTLNAYDNHGLNPLSDINPADIESIEILKDASSSSIYGSRAANGVVLITTKRGHEGKPTVTLSGQVGYSKLPRELSVLNAAQWRDIVIDSYKNLDYYNGATTPTEPHWTAIDSLNPMNSGDIDWQKLMYRTAKQYEANFSVQGGNADSKYAFSTSLLDQDGILISSNYTRITSRLNTDFKVSDRLKIGQSISYSHGITDRVSAGGTGNYSLVQSILVRPPVYSLTYPDGSPIYYFNGKRNPVYLAKECTHLNTANRIIGNQFLEFIILKGLKFKSSESVDFTAMKEDEFYPTTVDYRAGYNVGKVRSIGNLTWSVENYLTYDKSFTSYHHFSALAGVSTQSWKRETTGLDGTYFTSDNLITLNGAGTISNQAVNTTTEHSLASFFGRLSYNYKGKYLIETNLRADGSSRFGKNNRYGFFPSASAAWRFSDETFMKNQNIITDGKIRFSAGQTGNEAIGDYTSQGTFAIGTNYLDYSGAAPTVMPNADLTWETTTQYDLGLDISMFNNRISLSADAYFKRTTDLLFDVPIPETTGFSSTTQNLGDIDNKGIEVVLSGDNNLGNLRWNTSFNISFNKNVIKSLPKDLLTNGYIQNGSFHILEEGKSIGNFYGWKALGVYASDASNVNSVRNGSATGKVFQGGDIIWDDVNGDDVIDASDKQIIGNAQPLFIGGFMNDFSYKNFSLNIFFQFSYGNDIYSYLNYQRNMVFAYNNVSTDALRRWRKQGDITDYPRPIRNDPNQNDSRISSRWVEDGSYLRLKSITFSYDLPEEILTRLKMQGIKLYVTGQNLITWTHYTAYDPEVSSYSGLQIGVDEGAYPQNRTILFGVNFKF